MQTINTLNRTTPLTFVARPLWRLSRRAGHLPVPSRCLRACAPFALAGLLALTAASLTAGLPSVAPSLSPSLAGTPAAAPSLSSRLSLSSAVVLAAAVDQTEQREQGAAMSLHYQRGYSVQSGNWLCYGWANGAYHCTQHWYRASSGRYVSLNPSWVASQASAGGASVTVTTFTAALSAKPANAYPFGECTYGAEALAHDNLNGLGNARDWLANARARGLPTGYTPRVGATVTFQPGVQGASWLGHVGHVVALGANGAFEMEAMNDDAGFGRYAYRWVHVGSGVAFIY